MTVKETWSNVLDEIRLWICGELFSLVLWIVPGNEEGLEIVTTIYNLAKRQREMNSISGANDGN